MLQDRLVDLIIWVSKVHGQKYVLEHKLTTINLFISESNIQSAHFIKLLIELIKLRILGMNLRIRRPKILKNSQILWNWIYGYI